MSTLSGKQKGEQNREILRAWLACQGSLGARLPSKPDGKIHLAAVAKAAGIQAQTLNANPGCRKMVEDYGRLHNQDLPALKSRFDIDDDSVDRLTAFLAEVDSGKHIVTDGQEINLTIVADGCGMDPSLLFRSPRAMGILLAFADRHQWEMPRFATPQEVSASHTKLRRDQAANKAAQQLALAEAQIHRLLQEILALREENSRLKAKRAHDLEGIGL